MAFPRAKISPHLVESWDVYLNVRIQARSASKTSFPGHSFPDISELTSALALANLRCFLTLDQMMCVSLLSSGRKRLPSAKMGRSPARAIVLNSTAPVCMCG